MNLRGWLALLVGRFSRILLGYFVALLIFAANQHQYLRPIDMAVANALLRSRPQPKLDKRIAVVDLDVDGEQVRPAVVEFLSFVSKAVAAHKMDPPPKIVLDFYFVKDLSDTALLTVIRSLFYGGTKVYASLNPHKATGGFQNQFMGQHDQAIYDALAGSGHTDFSTENGTYPIVWYFASLPETVVTGETVETEYFALPLVAVYGAVPNSMHDVTLGFIAGANPPDKLYKSADLHHKPALLNNRDFVVVGSTKADKPFHDFAGVTLTAWALNDLVGVGNPAHISLFHNDVLFIAFSLALSLLGALCFVVAFQLARTAPWRLTAATTASAVCPVGILIAVILVAAFRNVIFAYSAFAFGAILTTTLACWAAGRAQVQRDLIVSRFVEGKTEVRRHPDVFISYSRDDENTAWVKDHIVKPLQAERRYDGASLDVFFDLEQIHSGAEWFETIVDALWGSRFMIAIYTPRYFERRMCIEELLTAMRRSVGDPAFVIVPVSRMAQEIPQQFAGIQMVEAAREPRFMDDIIARVCAASAQIDPRRTNTEMAP